jgi:hypothetical protein
MLRIIPLRWNNPQLNKVRSSGIFEDDLAKLGKIHRRTIFIPCLRLITIPKCKHNKSERPSLTAYFINVQK